MHLLGLTLQHFALQTIIQYAALRMVISLMGAIVTILGQLYKNSDGGEVEDMQDEIHIGILQSATYYASHSCLINSVKVHLLSADLTTLCTSNLYPICYPQNGH